jgi:glutamyl-tRNA synthetase
VQEWLVSTPRHVALYSAFGWTPPQFAHIGLLVDSNRQKLSKRHGNIDITSWKSQGILPIALLNYVLLMGWSPGKGQSEVMDMQEMIDNVRRSAHILKRSALLSSF